MGHPVCLIEKKRDGHKINLIRNKSRLHFFEIQSFFLNGYNLHSGEIDKTEKKSKR